MGYTFYPFKEVHYDLYLSEVPKQLFSYKRDTEKCDKQKILFHFIFMVLNCELTYVFIPFVSDIANVATV